LNYGEMMRNEIEITEDIYEQLFEACRLGGRLDLMLRWYEDMKEAYPDLSTYPPTIFSCIIDAQLEDKKLYDAINFARSVMATPSIKYAVWEIIMEAFAQRHTVTEDTQFMLGAFKEESNGKRFEYAHQRKALRMLDEFLDKHQRATKRSDKFLQRLEYRHDKEIKETRAQRRKNAITREDLYEEIGPQAAMEHKFKRKIFDY